MTRTEVAVFVLVWLGALALARWPIVGLARERNACARLNGGPVVTRWSVARGCWAEFYPHLVAPLGCRPLWLRLP